MNGRLHEKVAVITGGSAGIGAAAAKRFAHEGARVVIADINVEAGTQVVAAIERDGGSALFIETDVTRDNQAQAMVQRTMAQHGRLDILFNNAGGPSPHDNYVTEVDLDPVWDHTTTVDVKGTVIMCRHAIPAMAESGGGSIVNMSSGAALRGSGTSHIYILAKGAILSLTRALAGTYVKNGIRANAICAGRVATERTRRRYGLGGEAATIIDRENTMGRVEEYPLWLGTPEDVANIALFLASDESRMITGATIAADGGRSAY
jgi:NAD(P)-dependent dehydrogenase (short-subunit alcohol dehydrogenase family)